MVSDRPVASQKSSPWVVLFWSHGSGRIWSPVSSHRCEFVLCASALCVGRSLFGHLDVRYLAVSSVHVEPEICACARFCFRRPLSASAGLFLVVLRISSSSMDPIQGLNTKKF